MRITTCSLVFVCALLFTGCGDKPAASSKTENTINSTINQSSEKSSDKSSDDELLKYVKERDDKTAEDWRDVTSTENLKKRERNTKKW